jgi:hypothetical protein
MDIWCKCRFDGIVRVLLMGDIFTSFYLHNEESVGLPTAVFEIKKTRRVTGDNSRTGETLGK